ncbi:hypothetical protein F4780DRAFT_713451 [Xylariomycetidae sp. FL0641]|nr:hypothetical protein F4780DRAFT_713451 [Xylariomycetidae sp. FL0641]
MHAPENEYMLASQDMDEPRDHSRSPYPSRSQPYTIPETVKLTATLLFGLLVGFLLREVTLPDGTLPLGRIAGGRPGSNGPKQAAAAAVPVPVMFLEDHAYGGSPSPSSNAAWESLIPEGRGFVQLHGDASGSEGRYCVSVFHQLHCLDMLRRGYYAAAGSTGAADTEQHSHTTQSAHMQHCFDYIRQALMCAADPTLEERNDTIGGVRGWGTTHQCRDFDALKEWTSKHRYSDEGGIVN